MPDNIRKSIRLINASEVNFGGEYYVFPSSACSISDCAEAWKDKLLALKHDDLLVAAKSIMDHAVRPMTTVDSTTGHYKLAVYWKVEHEMEVSPGKWVPVHCTVDEDRNLVFTPKQPSEVAATTSRKAPRKLQPKLNKASKSLEKEVK